MITSLDTNGLRFDMFTGEERFIAPNAVLVSARTRLLPGATKKPRDRLPKRASKRPRVAVQCSSSKSGKVFVAKLLFLIRCSRCASPVREPG